MRRGNRAKARVCRPQGGIADQQLATKYGISREIAGGVLPKAGVLAAAYEGLSDPLKQLVDGLRAEHTFWAGYQTAENDPLDRSIMDMVNKKAMVSVHPVVRIHPEPARRSCSSAPRARAASSI
ncbi:TauD/TfdA family dioxygenase [Nocardia sp. NPDC049707]|uniref:TauD/TfdA dioxygenase family protein n=1 Tax=Nocardia sp. NPDC049707 TaxID=3154735 RepID=UPI0034197EBB